MKKSMLATLALIATSSLALAQGSSGGASTGAGTAGGAPGSVPSGTGGIGTAPSGGVGVPGGTGPGDPTVRPNIPEMRPSSPTAGREPGGSARPTSPSGSGLTSRPSSLNDPTAGTSSTAGSSDPTAPPPGAPRIMVPER